MGRTRRQPRRRAGSPSDALQPKRRHALACDPVSAVGSTVVFSEPVTESVAEELSSAFVECLVAPGYTPPALRILQQEQNLGILQPGGGRRFGSHSGHPAPDPGAFFPFREGMDAVVLL